jgi:hypothetical protein
VEGREGSTWVSRGRERGERPSATFLTKVSCFWVNGLCCFAMTVKLQQFGGVVLIEGSCYAREMPAFVRAGIGAAPHRSRLKVGSIPDLRPAPCHPPNAKAGAAAKRREKIFHTHTSFSRGLRRRQLYLPICQDARRRHRKDVAIRDPPRSRGSGGGSCSLPWLLRHVTLSPFEG